jgi:hypothetical protein
LARVDQASKLFWDLLSLDSEIEEPLSDKHLVVFCVGGALIGTAMDKGWSLFPPATRASIVDVIPACFSPSPVKPWPLPLESWILVVRVEVKYLGDFHCIDKLVPFL